MKPWLLLTAALIAPGLATAALPAPLKEIAPEWRALGKGELRWFGLALYEASLWVSGKRFEAAQPFALSLRYARNIPRSKLVSSSMSEMRRLGHADESQLKDWQQHLERVFPDVKEGETIVGVSVPGRGARFFHNGRSTGEVNDADFAQAFFAIWLDERTHSPDLRAQLLGGS